MAEHRSLGDAGRATRVLQEGDVGEPEIDRLQCMPAAGPQRSRHLHGVRQGECGHHPFHPFEHEVDQPAFGFLQQVADLSGDDVFDAGARGSRNPNSPSRSRSRDPRS
jgi:hypothetical protein